jgi:dsRNA-specific ribonuclease
MTFTSEDFKNTKATTYRDIVLAAIAALAVFGAILTVAQTVKMAAASDVTPVTVAAKADRVTAALPATCQGQAWGDWSADCLAEISGTANPRQVRFETFEARDVQGKTSVLARVPARS